METNGIEGSGQPANGDEDTGTRPPFGQDAKPLTRMESKVLRGLRDGLTLPQIATGLQRSELTIRTHIRNAAAKLQIAGSAELRRRLRAGELDVEISESD